MIVYWASAPFCAFTTTFIVFVPTCRLSFPVIDCTVANSLTGVAVTVTLVTSFGTVAVYCTVFPVKSGDNVPAESDNTSSELSAESVVCAAATWIPAAFMSEINRCIKILRKYCKLSIGEIKEAIISNNYVVECSYVKEEGIVNIIKLYKELCDNNIQAQLYEHERITNVEFLENLVETYYEINEEIADRIDTESE